MLIAQNTETKDYDCIKIDDAYGVKLAVEHLIELGHSDIGYIGDELSNPRLEVFMKIMQDNKMKINKKWIQVSRERFEKCGYELMSGILKSNDIPSAILGAYDDIAIGAIKAVHDRGLKVPDDISIVGIDNIRTASYYSPELTTVAGPVEEMGKIAVKLLFKKVKQFFEFREIFASILSRFSALFSNEVFAPVKKEVSVFIYLSVRRTI